MKKLFIAIISFMCAAFCAFGQEALKSFEEDYYDFLSLTGETNRNYINFRTLSDSVWEMPENHIWENRNLGTKFNLFEIKDAKENFFLNGIPKKVNVKVYGPEWFNSYNTKAPFGQNDGALWQGRGYNTSMSAGARIEAFGFEATIKPQVSFSQNLEFPTMHDKFGYWYGACDAVQRFGTESFWNYDWGDSEIRYSYYGFTMGFGTESVWLGPAFENPLLHSNNAPTYPKFDVGLRRTSMYFPYFDWYMGDIEFRSWVGKLTESAYFDENPENDHNQYAGFTIAWALPYFEGLSIGFNKICICKWGDAYWLRYLNPFFSTNVIRTNAEENINGEDQKASLTIDWLFEPVGFELFAEIGVDDYLSKGLVFYEYARYPFHTITYTLGFKKSLEINEEKKLRGLLDFEFDFTEGSRDYYNWPGAVYNFGCHGQIHQGYTNKGQWLGSGIGYGGNSQYLSFTLFSPHGYDKIFIGRNNPDNNYVNYLINVGVSANERAQRWFTAYKANFYIGGETMWFITKGLSVKGGFAYNLIINPLYDPGLSENGYYREYNYWNNYNFSLAIKYNF